MEYKRELQAIERYVRAYDAYQDARKDMTERSGELVRFWRELSKLSLRRFAKVIEVNASFLSKVERGLEPLPPEVARRILEQHRTL